MGPEKNGTTSLCNLAKGYEASCTVSNDGSAIVSVRSVKPINIKAVYVGISNLGFGWVVHGPWHFIPTIADPTPADYRVTTAGDDGQGQMVTVEMGKVAPASGFIMKTFVGEIWTPAIHFDLPHANDLWVFLLRSPTSPLKINAEKSNLRIAHSSAQAEAWIRSGAGEMEASLLVDLSVSGQGFKGVALSLQRISGIPLEQTIAQINNGSGTYVWKPFISNFDTMLTTYSTMDVRQFAVFSKYLGANVKTGLMRDDLISDFILCDGPDINYYLRLTGEKSFLGQEKDETRIKLNF